MEKHKGTLPNFLNPTLVEGFDYVNMTNCSYLLLPMNEDLKLYVFYRCFALMVGYLSNISSYDIMRCLVVELTCYCFLFMACL